MTPPPPSSRAPREPLVRPSPVEWVCLAAGLALVFRYRWILDDSCIYFRYVDNLVLRGRGLVYNPGEFVEGFSSPLWTLLLAVMRSTRVDYWSLVLFFGLASEALFWWLAVRIHRKLRGAGAQAGPVVDLPLVYLTANYGVASYFTSGSESPLVLLSAAVFGSYALEPDRRAWQVVLGALPLVRSELVVPLAAGAVAVGWATRKFPWWLLASACFCGFGWLAFRVVYYADLFPNPFYLKDRTAVRQGLSYLWNAFGPYHLPVYLGVLLWMSRALRRRGDADPRARERAILWIGAAASLVYVVKVGGDMMHLRFALFPFALLVLSTGGVLERWLTRTGRAPRATHRYAIAGVFGAAAFALYPWFLSSHPVFGREERSLEHGISDAPWHRYHPLLTYRADRRGEDRARLARYAASSAVSADVGSDVLCAAMFDDIDRRYVHGYGLTDPVLARTDVPESRPGHKGGLVALARGLASMRSALPDGGMHVGEAIARGIAPAWTVRDRDAIERIEARMYNRHEPWRNLAGALRPIPRLHP